MKTSLLFGATLAILGLAIVSMSAQTQSTTVQVSKLVGTKVKSAQGEEIGVVKDVVIDRNSGCMAYTVLSTGGGSARATAGGKLVAVPWAVYSPTSDVSALTVTVDRERIYNAPVFDYARIDEYSRPDYITNVYSYYGVSQGAGVGVGVSNTNTTTGVSAGASGRAGAAGSPVQGGSPAASASPGATRSPAERESPAGKASPTPHATAAKPHATASSREREGAESPPAREERSRRGRPGETESPSSKTREERGTRARPEETESPGGGAELQREPSSRASRESSPEAANPSERTGEGTQNRPHRKPGRREANTPPPEEQN
ncbi:MAG TPA: PRC-barrel domain-containing protein [Candidatus Udaeobacter sp.]|nr:PRC-barrel domain-containing protein [Candidatus Udaeobacter sp.]